MKQYELESEKPLYFAQYSTTVKKELYERKFKLLKIISGKAIISNANERIEIEQGQFAFVGPGCFSRIEMKPQGTIQFKLVCLNFEEHLLTEYSKHNAISPCTEQCRNSLIKLKESKWLGILFLSLQKYITSEDFPDDFLVKIKQMECLHIINRIYPEIMAVMFQKTKTHKINLETFMEENYMYNAPLERFAELSGRSLSSFRRNFMEIFHTTPNKWIIDKRLSVAYEMLEDGNRRPSEVYWEVGFETLAHFSRRFKEKYGFPPTHMKKQKV